MKKLLLLGLAFSVTAGLNTADAQWGTKIGKSWYDLQSNAAVGNRIVKHDDGSISAVWIESCAGNPAGNASFATRGTGYNYLPAGSTTWQEGADGTCNEAGADYGVNTKKTGWGEIIALPGGKEMVIAHTGTGITVTSRTPKGQQGLTGWSTSSDLAWTTNITSLSTPAAPTTPSIPVTGATGHNGTWPRAVAVGNTIHMIYAVNNSSTSDPSLARGVESPFVYSRSTDGGVTWDKQNVMLNGLDGSLPNGVQRVGGDSYAIHARGNTVAITAGGLGEPWTLWKSTDNGSTWTSKAFDVISNNDTLNIVNSSGNDTAGFMQDVAQSVVIDNNDVVHAFAGQMAISVKTSSRGFVLNEDAAGSVTYYPLMSDGILYWNDGALANDEAQLIALREDVTSTFPGNWVGDGTYLNPRRPSPYGLKSMTSTPTAAVDASNNVYVVYSGVVEGTSNNGDSTGQSFRDLYVMKGSPLTRGFVWSDPINIADVIINYPNNTVAGSDFEEETYPSVIKNVGTDNLLHMTWQFDFEPGLAVNGDLDTESEYGIMYHAIDVSAVNFNTATVLGTAEEVAIAKGVVAYPNPTTGKVTITFGDVNAAKAEIKVVNVMGQTVNVPVAKTGNAFNLDLSNVANGVYIYTITSDNATVTSRIVKN